MTEQGGYYVITFESASQTPEWERERERGTLNFKSFSHKNKSCFFYKLYEITIKCSSSQRGRRYHLSELYNLKKLNQNLKRVVSLRARASCSRTTMQLRNSNWLQALSITQKSIISHPREQAKPLVVTTTYNDKWESREGKKKKICCFSRCLDCKLQSGVGLKSVWGSQAGNPSL